MNYHSNKIRVYDTIYKGFCVYCGDPVERKTDRKWFSCDRCATLLKRNKLERFNKVLKRADFIYGRKTTDAYIDKILRYHVGKLYLHDLIKVV